MEAPPLDLVMEGATPLDLVNMEGASPDLVDSRKVPALWTWSAGRCQDVFGLGSTEAFWSFRLRAPRSFLVYSDGKGLGAEEVLPAKDVGFFPSGWTELGGRPVSFSWGFEGKTTGKPACSG